MIYDQIEFHNVEEIITTDRGCRLSRLPLSIARQLNEGIPNSRAYMGTGVELRFRMPKREVTLHPTLEGQLMVAQRWSEVMKRAYDG